MYGQEIAHRLDQFEQRLACVEGQLDRVESVLKKLLHQQTPKRYYSPAEAAEILGKAEFTVREWCRLGRVRAHKRACGRGHAREWIIAREELTRIQNEGLLPVRRTDGGDDAVDGS